MLLSFFYKGISPFLDPVTRDKVSYPCISSSHETNNITNQMRFNPNLDELIPPSHLDADFGGQFHYEFEPHSYWEQIVS